MLTIFKNLLAGNNHTSEYYVELPGRIALSTLVEPTR
ncbi:unnamed protein product, partial [Amoebophrya sp. A120]|eukprot:GSA120T00023098001.1